MEGFMNGLFPWASPILVFNNLYKLEYYTASVECRKSPPPPRGQYTQANPFMKRVSGVLITKIRLELPSIVGLGKLEILVVTVSLHVLLQFTVMAFPLPAYLSYLGRRAVQPVLDESGGVY